MAGELSCHTVSASITVMSPTIFPHRGYRFYCFSREEPRLHAHVISPEGEAEFWLDPSIELAANKGLNAMAINELTKII